MSDPSVSDNIPAAVREQTLARFEQHRKAWQSNQALRRLYGDWYGRLREAMPPVELGPRVELGSGPGFAREFIPDLLLTDVVQASWHDRCVSAEALSFADESLGALLLFDVLHHVEAPAKFFAEATRVLRPDDRLLLYEPYIGPVSRWVYGLFHEEPVDMRADPWARTEAAGVGKDPFESNQAIPTLIFCRNAGVFAEKFPSLRVRSVERMAGFAYPFTGGFSRQPLLPTLAWNTLYAIEKHLPGAAFRLIGFRLLVVIERV